MMLDHVTIRTTDVEGTRGFFESLLDLKVGHRPDLGGFGYWLYDGSEPIVHLVSANAPISDPNSEGYDHIAFRLPDYDAVILRLQSLGLAYSEYKIPELKEHRIFVKTPLGLSVELCISGYEGP